MSDEDELGSFVPHDPPLCSTDLAAVGGRLGDEPEDFVVEELLEPNLGSEGEHLWVQIRKRRLTTQDAIAIVARAAGVRPGDVGSAGMKDKHALTTQWLSLPREATSPEQWDLPAGLEVLAHGRNPKKLRTGQLSGNRFALRLVDVGPRAREHAGAIFDRIRSQGLPNYFGAQRFGIAGSNLARAREWLAQSADRGRRRSRFHAKLYPSVIQSEVFNRYVTLRRRHGIDQLLDGEVVRLDGTGSTFVVDDPEREVPRLRKRDIHLTGPIIGPKMRAARGRALELEMQAIREARIDAELQSQLGRLADGTRRDVLVFPAELGFEVPREGVLEIRFSLPSGSYATQLVRELTRGSFLGPRGPAAEPRPPAD